MNRAVIEVDGVGKRYAVKSARAPYRTLRETLARPFARRPSAPDLLWALKDVNFEVDRGEAVGVVGRNGAGKSTLLKILSRITEPTTGVSRTRGQVGALLEVGTGFHPELTGRENVQLNGAILGMSRADLRRRFDDIVEFAGVERFLDTPLKHYSSGMALRLAFSVAAHVEPEIVIVDEVLAVGDAEFQQRCMQRMSGIVDEGRTVLFVSHDLGAIARLCKRSIWLERGQVEVDGPTAEVLAAYALSRSAQSSVQLEHAGDDSAARVRAVRLVDVDGGRIDELRRDDTFIVEVDVEIRERGSSLDLAVFLTRDDGVRVLDETYFDVLDRPLEMKDPGLYTASLRLPGILAPGSYLLGVWLGTEYETFLADDGLLHFELAPRLDDRDEAIRRARVVLPPVTWAVRRS